MTTIAIKSANTPPVFDGIARKWRKPIKNTTQV